MVRKTQGRYVCKKAENSSQARTKSRYVRRGRSGGIRRDRDKEAEQNCSEVLRRRCRDVEVEDKAEDRGLGRGRG